MKGIARHSLLLGLLVGGSPMALADAGAYTGDLFELSLEELMDLRIDGGAVRDLALMAPANLGNAQGRPILNVAATVEVIDQKTMASRGLDTVVEVADNMVGILSGESPSEPYSLSMRGFTRDTVKVLYDGIAVGTATLNMRPLSTHNLSRVEVVKGASMLQNGPGSTAGTINFVSKQPQQTDHNLNTASLSVGEYDDLSIGADLNLPWQSGAVRLNLYHRDAEGWVDDADFNSTDLHLKALFALSDTVDLTLSASYLEDDLPAYWGTPLVPTDVARSPSKAVRTDDGRVLDESLRFTNYNVNDHVIESQAHWYRADSLWRISPALSNRTTLYTYRADRQWRNAESYIYDDSTGQVDRDRLLVEHDRSVWGLKNDLLWQGVWLGYEHNLTVALELSENEFDRVVGFDEVSFFVDAVALRDPIAGQFGTVSERPDSHDESILALVVEDWVALTNAWHLEWGLRQERVEVDRQRYNFDGSLRQNLVDTFDMTSYRLALGYQLSANASTYLQYSLQHDAIEGELISPLVDDVADYAPSDTRQWEMGLKMLMHDGLSQLTVALYDIEKRSKLALAADPNHHEAQQRSTGVELALANQLTERVKLGFNLAYVDARYGHFYDPDYGRDVSGNTPMNVPDTQASLWATYSRFMGWPLELGAGVNHVADRFANSSNMATLDAYQLLHLFAAYNVDDLRVMLQVRNVTDEVYVPWADIYYPDQALIGPPRQVKVSASLRF